jgi:hypothetical protein
MLVAQRGESAATVFAVLEICIYGPLGVHWENGAHQKIEQHVLLVNVASLRTPWRLARVSML